MKSFDEYYFSYFVPLIQEFVREMERLPNPNIKSMPEPHLPLFGKSYEDSALKLVIIGQDTAWWGDLLNFIAAEKANPGSKLIEGLNKFRERPFMFSRCGPRQTFWGFTMMMIADLHGQEDWAMMKQGKMDEIVDSIAWAEANAIEFYSDRTADVPRNYWESVRAAGQRFNRFKHIVETLHPDVAVVMNRGIDPSYFEGYSTETLHEEGRLVHYRLPEVGVDVFLTPHPRSMNFNEGTEYFRDKLKDLFVRHGLTAIFPQFLEGQEEGKQAITYLKDKAPKPDQGDKFDCVAWIADELKKRNTFMSVPALCALLNELGYRTNYAEEFTGGRGSYRLVRGTYHRQEQSGQPERAHNVALAFRRPNFEYAYE